jgi:hypothetical protein
LGAHIKGFSPLKYKIATSYCIFMQKYLKINIKYFVYEYLCKVKLNFAILYPKMLFLESEFRLPRLNIMTDYPISSSCFLITCILMHILWNNNFSIILELIEKTPVQLSTNCIHRVQGHMRGFCLATFGVSISKWRKVWKTRSW